MSILHASQIMPEVLSKYTHKAIPTEYQGILFRSRSEARWAVFFNTLGIRWEYEKEGYQLGDICYLPDFWLPEQDCWFEVKGADPDDLDCKKSSRLALYTGKVAYITFNEMALPGEPRGIARFHVFFPGETPDADMDYTWCECPNCGKLGITYLGYADRLPCKARHNDPGCPKHSRKGDKAQNHDSSRIISAYKTARRERFGT